MNPFKVTHEYDTEAQNQAALFTWIRMCAEFGPHAADTEESYTARGVAAMMKQRYGWDPGCPVGKCLRRTFAIPNGAELKSVRTAGAQIAQGLTSGIPDIFVPWRPGFFIELKVRTGKLSDVQKKTIDDLSSLGYLTITSYGWLAAKQAIRQQINF